MIIVSVSRVNDPSPLTHDIQLFQQKTPSPWKTSNPVVCSNTHSLTHSHVPNWKKKKLARWLRATLARQSAFIHSFSFRVILFSLPSVSPIPYLAYRVLAQSPHSLCSTGFASKGRKEGEVAKMVRYCKHAMCIYIYALNKMLPGSGKGGEYSV